MNITYKGKRSLKTITVIHPTYGRVVAEKVVDNLSAVQAAAKKWGLQWSKIARECTFEDVTPHSSPAATPSPRGEDSDPSLRLG